MKSTMNRSLLAPGLMLATLGLVATPAAAVDLATYAFDKTMPDGEIVPMWGFVLDPQSGGDRCYQQSSDAARLQCVEDLVNSFPNGPDGIPASGDEVQPMSPGPRLNVNDDTGNINIRLTNTLEVPVSLVIPGQEIPWSNGCSGPVWSDGSSGARTSAAQRVRSFGCEASENGGRRQYRWRTNEDTQFQTGSYIYQSGTHPQVQVQMGLYGAIRRDFDNDAAINQAYDGVFYEQQRDLFYSEIDPALHDAVDAGTFTGSTLDYNPKYFLLERAVASNGVQTWRDDSIDAGDTGCIGLPSSLVGGDPLLLRLYNAGLRELAPTMIGSHFDVVAEGGKPYLYAPRQYSVLLQPASTKDLLVTLPQAGGRTSLIERRLSLTDPGLMGSVNGGMQTCFNFNPGPVLRRAGKGGPVRGSR